MAETPAPTIPQGLPKRRAVTVHYWATSAKNVKRCAVCRDLVNVSHLDSHAARHRGKVGTVEPGLTI